MLNLYKKLGLLLIAILTIVIGNAQQKIDTTQAVVPMSLSQIWDKAEVYNKQIQIGQLHVQSS